MKTKNNLVRALADGIRDAGVRHFSNYPGFHANELHAELGAGVTSTDEKNAFAFGWGCSMAGERAAVSFKNVGLNDAADAYLGAHFVGCRAGLVLFLFDDCDIQHSQSRIDVRPYFLVYGGLWLEPRTVPEAYRFARDAFRCSERFGLPVTIRLTNALWDQGLLPAEWTRMRDEPPPLESVRRLQDASPWVVHPSEAHRMEQDLARKNREIAQFVETLYAAEPIQSPEAVVMGAKRGVRERDLLRLFTLPVPVERIRACFDGKPRPVVYEHGPVPIVARLVEDALAYGRGCPHRGMPPPPGMRPKYHNHDYMEKLFSVLRAVPDALVAGDLGGYTMDPGRTLHFCLCYGVAPAVAMGLSEANPGRRIFCVTGDAAYLHSGQACLHEMAARGVDATVFVLENGGALGTGGQPIPGDLSLRPADCSFHEIDYADVSAAELRIFVEGLSSRGIHLVIIHTHEQDAQSNPTH